MHVTLDLVTIKRLRVNNKGTVTRSLVNYDYFGDNSTPTVIKGKINAIEGN